MHLPILLCFVTSLWNEIISKLILTNHFHMFILFYFIFLIIINLHSIKKTGYTGLHYIIYTLHVIVVPNTNCN